MKTPAARRVEAAAPIVRLLDAPDEPGVPSAAGPAAGVARRADSDILARATAEEMTRRGPKPRLHEFAGVGHVGVRASETCRRCSPFIV